MNYGSASISVISDSTNNIVPTNITVGSSPADIAYDSAKGEMFVSDSAANTVLVISDTTNSIVADIPIGLEPG